MATRTANRSSSRSGNRNGSDRSVFDWGSGSAIAAAALGGAALALIANLGRKAVVQSPIARDNWYDALAADHEMVLEIFDKMLATDESQTVKRKMLLMKLGHALDRHSYAEEHVVYPALREANDKADAAELETEHGEVKTFLFRLNNMTADDAAWIDTVREFRNGVEAHARLEEDEVFPRLRSEISEDLDAKLTREVAKASFMMA